MRPIFIACLWITAAIGQCHAQMSLSPDHFGTQVGIVTHGSHSAVMPSQKLRFFIFLEASAETPQLAVTKLNAEKAKNLTAAMKAGATQDSVEFTSIKILEWQPDRGVFSNNESALEPKMIVEHFTAATLCSFDISLEGIASDAFADRIHKVRALLPSVSEPTAFKPDPAKVAVLHVAEIDAAQAAAAQKKAYDKAVAKAKTLASFRNKPLGKLVAMKLSDNNKGVFGIEQNFLWRNYSPKESEAMSSDPQKLSREYTVRLRFEIDQAE